MVPSPPTSLKSLEQIAGAVTNRSPPASQRAFSWQIYAVSATLLFLHTATSVDAQLSPLLEEGTHSHSRTHGICNAPATKNVKHGALFAVEGTSFYQMYFSTDADTFFQPR